MRSLLSLAALAFLVAASVIVPCVRSADETKDESLALLKGHKEAVYSVCYTPDGKFLLAANGEPLVKVYQIAGGKEIKSFGGANGHKQLILALAVKPDGSEFATASADNSVKLWDFPTDKHQREFATSDDSRAVAVSPDGTKLAGGSKDGKVRLWTAADGKQTHEIAAHTGAVSGLAFNANATVLASVGVDGTLKYWNTADGKSAGAFAAHPGAVTGLAHSPNSPSVYTSGIDGSVRFWGTPAPSRELAPAFKDAISSLSLSPDGTQVVAAADKTVRLSTLANGQTIRELAGATASVHSAALNTGNALVAAGTADRRVALWQTKDGVLLSNVVAHGGAVHGVAFNPTGDKLATAGKDGLIRLWAMPPLPLRSVAPGGEVRAAVLSPDGKRLAAAGADKNVRLYKLDNLKAVERQITGPVVANAIALSADNLALVTAGDDGVVRFFGQAKGDATALIGGHTGPVSSVAYLNATQVLSASADGTLKLWTVPAVQTKNNFAHAGSVTSAVLSPDGQKLLTGCDDKQVRLWNLTTGQVERTWTGPTLAVGAVAFSPKGDRVAAGSADKSVTVWEAASNKEVKKFANLSAVAQSVALSADGKHAVCGLSDGNVKLLDIATGKEAATIAGHKGSVDSLLFNAKGELVYGGAEGVVIVRGVAAKDATLTITHGSAISAIALGVNGTKAAVGGTSKEVKVYDAAKGGKEELTITTPAAVRGIAYSADGKRLAVAGDDGKTRVYAADGNLEEYFAHDGAVNAVAFAADGKRVLSGGADKTARVWPLSLLWQAKHGAAVAQATASTRGVVTAGADGVVRIWAAADGKAGQSFRAHAGAVSAVAVSVDATRIVTAGADKTARVWDWAKMPATQVAGKDVEKATLQMALSGAPESATLTPDGKRLAVSIAAAKAADSRVQLFDTTAGTELIALGEPEGLAGKSLAFLADNRTLFAGGGSSVNFVDVNILGSFKAHKDGVASLAFHSNGTQLLSGGADKTAKLWTFATGKLDRTFGPAADAISNVAFSRDYAYAAATAGKALKVWTTADGKEAFSLAMPSEASSLSFNADKTRVATGNADGRARTWELAAKTEGQSFLHSGAVSGVAFHPTTPTQLVTSGADKTASVHTLTLARLAVATTPLNGVALAVNQNHLLSAGANGKVTFWNLGSGIADRTIDGDEKGVSSVTVSRNFALIAVGGVDKKVRVFEYANPKMLAAFTAPAVPKSLAFSPDNKSLVAAGADGGLTTWDVTYTAGQQVPAEFGKVLQSSAHAAEAFDLAFPTQGALFYSSGADKTVKAWRVASDGPTKTLAHPQSVNCLAYSKDGSQLLTGSADGKVRLWDAAKGTIVREITAHAQPNNTSVYCVAFSPDEKQIVSGSIDQTLKLWTAADGKMVREFKAYKEKEFPKGHQEAVLSASFSPDGKQLASGGMDRCIKIWNVADGTVTHELNNPAYKPAVADALFPSHPGWVYGVRWVDGGKKLLSAGQAPRLKGYLATWDPATGKLLTGKELSYGSIFALAVSPDEKSIAIGTGGSVRSGEELNLGVILKMP